MIELLRVFSFCVMQAASVQQIPPAIIITILETEGGKVGMATPNVGKDGKVFSYDLGPMQVNDRVWAPVLANKHFGGNIEAAKLALRENGCYNIHVGAWIFRGYLDEANGDYLEAVGFYNSHTPSIKKIYQKKFQKNFKRLFGTLNQGN